MDWFIKRRICQAHLRDTLLQDLFSVNIECVKNRKFVLLYLNMRKDLCSDKNRDFFDFFVVQC